MKRKGKIFGRILAALAAAAVLAWGGIAALTENAEESRYVKIESADGLSLAGARAELYPADLIRADLDMDEAEGKDIIEADLTLPILAPNIYQIILTDGWRVAYSVWKITGEHTAHVIFVKDDLSGFLNTKNLYLAVICSTRPMD